MSKTYTRQSTSELRAEATSYYALCDRAAALGVPVSLDDHRAARTTRGLRRAVRQAERAQVAA